MYAISVKIMLSQKSIWPVSAVRSLLFPHHTQSLDWGTFSYLFSSLFTALLLIKVLFIIIFFQPALKLHAKEDLKKKREKGKERERKTRRGKPTTVLPPKRTHGLQISDFSLPSYLILCGRICSFRHGLASCDSET